LGMSVKRTLVIKSVENTDCRNEHVCSLK
jgi:hypothetical protein